MSPPLLPLNSPVIQLRLAMGTDAGNRASVLQFQAQFLVGVERDTLLYLAECEISIARWHFTYATQRADFSEPDVRLSNETWRAFEAERGRAAKEQPIYPGKGAHWAAKRAAKAA